MKKIMLATILLATSIATSQEIPPNCDKYDVRKKQCLLWSASETLSGFVEITLIKNSFDFAAGQPQHKEEITPICLKEIKIPKYVITTYDEETDFDGVSTNVKPLPLNSSCQVELNGEDYSIEINPQALETSLKHMSQNKYYAWLPDWLKSFFSKAKTTKATTYVGNLLITKDNSHGRLAAEVIDWHPVSNISFLGNPPAITVLDLETRYGCLKKDFNGYCSINTAITAKFYIKAK